LSVSGRRHAAAIAAPRLGHRRRRKP
jgi:hypothetical protein